MIDLLDPALHASGKIMEAFRTLRATSPVAWCPGRRGPGYWAITGHPELVEAARDADSFSSFWGTRPEVVRPEGAPRPLHNLDAPEHGVLRTIAASTLSSTVIDALDPVMVRVIAERFASLRERGCGDVVRDLAEPIVTRVFAAWLGMPEDAAPELFGRVIAVHTAGAALLDVPKDAAERPARVIGARLASDAMVELMRGAVAAARAPSARVQQMSDATRTASPERVNHTDGPRSGVLERLHALPTDEAVRLASLFVEAGVPTLVDAIGGGVVDLLEHPEVRIEDDLPSAIEEILRRASPIAQFARRATRRAVLGDVTIEAGDQIVMWFASANRDERVFGDPDAFLVRRAPNPHVAFGMGPHRCIGAALGRRLLRHFFAAFTSLRTDAAGHRIQPAGPFERRASSYLRGYARVPITLR